MHRRCGVGCRGRGAQVVNEPCLSLCLTYYLCANLLNINSIFADKSREAVLHRGPRGRQSGKKILPHFCQYIGMVIGLIAEFGQMLSGFC